MEEGVALGIRSWIHVAVGGIAKAVGGCSVDECTGSSIGNFYCLLSTGLAAEYNSTPVKRIHSK